MSKLIDFAGQGSGSAVLVRAIPRVDPGTEDTLQWDVDLQFAVGSDEDAAAAEGLVPDASEYRGRALDKKGSAVIKVKPTSKDLRVMIGNEAGVEVIGTRAAEIRHLQFSVTERAQFYTARLRMFDCCPDDAAAIARVLGKVVVISAEPAQPSLFDDGSEGWTPGDVVVARTGETDVHGIYRGEKAHGHLVDDFGVLHTADQIISSLRISDDGDLAASYRSQVADAGGMPTWGALVTSLAQAHAAGSPVKTGPGEWILTDEVVAAAVAMHLPPEAGEAPRKGRAALRAEAKALGNAGYSRMTVAELEDAICGRDEASG